MTILHCIRKSAWDTVKNTDCFGQDMLDAHGFIHCSSIEYFWRVAPNFKQMSDALLLLCIETEALEAEVKWEDSDNCGRSYPHIYGLINTSSVKAVLPYKKDENGNWQKTRSCSTFKISRK